MKKLVASLFFAFSSMSYAEPIYVAVEATVDDTVGRQIVYHTRELLRKSAAFSLVEATEDAGLLIRIVSMEPDGAKASNRTIYSLVFTANDKSSGLEYFLNHYIAICSLSRVESCARSIVAYADETLSNLRKQFRK